MKVVAVSVNEGPCERDGHGVPFPEHARHRARHRLADLRCLGEAYGSLVTSGDNAGGEGTGRLRRRGMVLGHRLPGGGGRAMPPTCPTRSHLPQRLLLGGRVRQWPDEWA